MNLNCSKGQGLIEALISLPVIFLTLFGLGKILYRQVLLFSFDYHLHEALVCAMESPTRSCKHELEKRLNSLLLNNEKLHLYLREDIAFIYGHAEVDLNPNLKIVKKLRKRLN